MRHFFSFIICLLILSGCSEERFHKAVPDPVLPIYFEKSNKKAAENHINIGDIVRVSVFQEPDLSGNHNVLNDGSIQIPLIGGVQIDGLKLTEASKLITQKFKDGGYLINPNVTVSILSNNAKECCFE